MLFATHIKIKIVQTKISIDKPEICSKQTQRKTVKSKWSSCEESLKCDYRYWSCFWK